MKELLTTKISNILERRKTHPKSLSEESDMAAFELNVPEAAPVAQDLEAPDSPPVPPAVEGPLLQLDDADGGVELEPAAAAPSDFELLQELWGEDASDAAGDDRMDEKDAGVDEEVLQELNDVKAPVMTVPFLKSKTSKSKRRRGGNDSEDDEHEKKRKNFIDTLDQELFAAFMHDSDDKCPWFGKIVSVKTVGTKKKKTTLGVHWYVPNTNTQELEPCWVDPNTQVWTMVGEEGKSKPYVNLVSWDMSIMWNLKTEANNKRKLTERDSNKAQRQWQRNTDAKSGAPKTASGNGKRSRKQTDTGFFTNSQLAVDD